MFVCFFFSTDWCQPNLCEPNKWFRSFFLSFFFLQNPKILRAAAADAGLFVMLLLHFSILFYSCFLFLTLSLSALFFLVCLFAFFSCTILNSILFFFYIGLTTTYVETVLHSKYARTAHTKQFETKIFVSFQNKSPKIASNQLKRSTHSHWWWILWQINDDIPLRFWPVSTRFWLYFDAN